MKGNPDKHLTEIATHFSVSVGSLCHSLKKLGIMRKKDFQVYRK